MPAIPLIRNNPARLSDAAASPLLALLYELAAALEHHAAAQLRRHHADLFADFDDALPEF